MASRTIYYRTVVAPRPPSQAPCARRTRRVITHAMTDQTATQQSIPTTFVAVSGEGVPFDIEKNAAGGPRGCQGEGRGAPKKTRPSTTAGMRVRALRAR